MTKNTNIKSSTTTIKVQDHIIRQLNEDNLNDWLVNIRAILRPLKLWKYATNSTSKNDKEWLNKAKKTIDIMIFTISSSIKKKLNNNHFNNNYVMLQRIKEKLQLNDDAQFMRLTQKYYSLDYSDFKGMSKFLDHVKILEERIDATNIELTKNKRTLICIMMTLVKQSNYRSLIQIWNASTNITASKARAMLLEKYRQQEHIEAQNENINTTRKLTNWQKYDELERKLKESIKKECNTCGKSHENVCWKKDLDARLDWMKIKNAYYKEKNNNKETMKKIKLISHASTTSSIFSSHSLSITK